MNILPTYIPVGVEKNDTTRFLVPLCDGNGNFSRLGKSFASDNVGFVTLRKLAIFLSS